MKVQLENSKELSSKLKEANLTKIQLENSLKDEKSDKDALRSELTTTRNQVEKLQVTVTKISFN